MNPKYNFSTGPGVASRGPKRGDNDAQINLVSPQWATLTLKIVMRRYPCKYLKGEVELSDERFEHIARRHPDFLPTHEARIAEVLAEPDQIRRSKGFRNARLFTRSYTDVAVGKFVVIVVVTDNAPKERHWVITGYIARKISEGEIEWKRN